MFEYRGRTALVTGASVGIGAAFARELARRGMNLVINSRSREALEKIAEQITRDHNIFVDVIVADLSQESAVATIVQQITERGLTIDLLVNNAGFKNYGRFEEIDPAQEQAQVMVNVATVVGLSRALLPGMLQRQFGAIINVGSITAFQPVPFMAVYAASKAFVVSFSLAIAEEYRGRGIRIVTLCPGPTQTELFIRSKSTEVVHVGSHQPEQVVATALRALERGRGLIVDGWKNTLLTYCSSLLPRSFTTMMAGRQVRPKK